MKQRGDILLNPIRMRIIQLMAGTDAVTVSQLAQRMKDIPKTTLYRHINLLSEYGYITVSREIRVRGTYEREYILNFEMLQTSPEDIEKSTNTFLMKLLADFSHYFREKGDPSKDRLFLSGNTLVLSDTEYEIFLDELFNVIKKHMNLPAEGGRRVRTLSVISSPGREEETNVG